MHFDIRSQLFMLLILNICVFLFKTILMESLCVILVFSVHILCLKKKCGWKLFIAYFVFLYCQQFIFSFLPDGLRIVLNVPMVNMRKMIPLFMCFVLMIRSLEVSEISATFLKMKIPQEIITTFVVGLRYFPTLKEEWNYILEGMSLRRLTVFDRNPIKVLKKCVSYYLVPLFISASLIIEDISNAAVTRGIDSPCERSCWKYHSMRIQDYILMSSVLLIMICGIVKVYFLK